MGEVRKDSASHNSIALSWSQVEQPPSNIVDYEVKYYEKVVFDIITDNTSAAVVLTSNYTRKRLQSLSNRSAACIITSIIPNVLRRP